MIICGDVLATGLPDEYATACLCDPPYGLGFMGKSWDHGVPGPDYWREVWRVLRPGAVLMAFGGTRTWHRLAVAIEDAGFEMQDTMMWLYGSGFPKSHDVSKGIDAQAGAEHKVIGYNANINCYSGRGPFGESMVGKEYGKSPIVAPATPAAAVWSGYGTALKPAWEPILLARKPRQGTYADCAVEHGAGALWIDGGRVGVGAGGDVPCHSHWSERAWGFGRGRQAGMPTGSVYSHDVGRWPANLLLDEASAEMLGEQSGVSKSTGGINSIDDTRTIYDGGWKARGAHAGGLGDTGTAARFFYCAKAARRERDAGLEGVAERAGDECHGDGLGNDPDRIVRRNHHPTVKPLDLCRYLATLLRPPEPYLADAVLLVPFAGSGSEMIGGYLAGWRNVVGIERSEEYAAIAKARIAWWRDAMSQTGRTDPREVLAVMHKIEAQAQPALELAYQ